MPSRSSTTRSRASALVHRAWLRLSTLSKWHVVAWVVFSVVVLISTSSYQMGGAVRAAETQEAERAASIILTAAEADFVIMGNVLATAANDRTVGWCSPEQLARLNEVDFESREIVGFRLYDAQGKLECNSRSAPPAHVEKAPAADAAYRLGEVTAASLPLLSSRLWVYTLRLGRMDVEADATRWLRFVDKGDFNAVIEDAKSHKLIARVPEPIHGPFVAAASGEHFLVQVAPTGAFAARWLDLRKTWLWPLLAFTIAACGLVTWLLWTHLNSTESRLKRIIIFQPEKVVLVYQPVVSIKATGVGGAEALLRLQDEHGVTISPLVVFSAIERNAALSQRLTCQIVETALREMGPWLREDRSRFVAVNACNHDFDSALFPEHVRRILGEYDILASQLHIEMLETAQLLSSRCNTVMQALRDMGCQLWIDDFGVGYSNLARLHSLPVNGVKLDRDWIEGLDETQISRIDAVTHLILFAASHGYGIVAEGVSDEGAMRTLLRLGVDEMQGFLFSPGLPLPAFLQLAEMPISATSPRNLKKALGQLPLPDAGLPGGLFDEGGNAHMPLV